MEKIFAILLVIAMLVTVFVGCSKKPDDNSSTAGNTNSPTGSSSTYSIGSPSEFWEKYSVIIETTPGSSKTSSTNTSSTVTSSKDTSTTTSGATSSVNPEDEGWSSWWEPPIY